jgi:hypothetical protein
MKPLSCTLKFLHMDEYHFTSALEISTNKLWGAHIRVPDAIAQVFATETDDRRVVCTVAGKSTFQCALLHDGKGSFLIMLNKALRDKHKLQEGSLVEASIRKDESEYGLPMPSELDELLTQDPAGKDLFMALSAGKIRTLLHIVGSVKSSDLRIRRSIAILEHLKDNAGKLDYKQLHLRLKDS